MTNNKNKTVKEKPQVYIASIFKQAKIKAQIN